MRSHESRSGEEIESVQPLPRGLLEAAVCAWTNPRIRETFELFASGEIHQHAGGTLRALNGTSHIFWHDNGTYVASDGAVYHLRSDDDGTMQAYVAPVDERGRGARCIQPYTYDSYKSQDGRELRVDFINGAHHAPPKNSLVEVASQRSDDLDVSVPRHQNGTTFDCRRDSVSVVTQQDGTVIAKLYDGYSGVEEMLYTLADVRSLVCMLYETE